MTAISSGSSGKRVMTNQLLATEVFTPTQPATYTFVERDEATSRRIAQALQTPGMQIVLYGPTGSGKTTLIRNKLDQLGPEHTVTCRCTASTTFSEILTSAMSKLNAVYVAEESSGRGQRSLKVTASILGTGGGLEYTGKQKPETVTKSVTRPPVTVEQLGEYLGKAKAPLIIEDLHKVANKEKERVAEAMKLFMDLAAEYPVLRMIVLGARDTAEDILSLDTEMKNRVAEIGVSPMTRGELKQILKKGEGCLNISFPDTVANRIVLFCCGMPAVAHQLALNLCFEAGVQETISPPLSPVVLDAGMLEAATYIYLEDQAATFRKDFEAASRSKRSSKFDNYRTILRTLSYALGGLTRSELLQRIQRRYNDYPPSNLSVCLKRLTTNGDRGGLIVVDPLTKKYKFEDPKACAYAAMRFSAEKWADYCIVAVNYSEKKLIQKVQLLRDEGDRVEDIQPWNRAELIDAMLKGTTFTTVKYFDSESVWRRQKEVSLVELKGKYFLRVDDESIEADTLGDLPDLMEAETF